MKILYHHRIRSKDGQFVHVEEMVGALRSLGHDVIIAAPRSMESNEFGSDAGLVQWMKRHLPHFIYELLEFSYSFIAYWRLSKAVRFHQPDVLYERYNLFMPAGVWIKHRFGIPMLLEVNSPLYEERSRYDGISLKSFAQWSERYVWSNADYVLPVTRVMGDIIAAKGIPENRICIVPNGINLERFSVTTDTESAKLALGIQGKMVLGFTGFVRSWHGLDDIIDMIANDDENLSRHLLVVGDGPARSSLEAQAHRLGIADRVTFTGIIGRNEVSRYVAAFDIALQPAVVAYASPLKLFEYLMLGRAIVAPSQPNIMEILSDGVNAVLFDPDKPGGLSEAINRVSNDAELRQKIAAGAHACIDEQGLTWRRNAERVIDKFNELLAKE